MLREEVAVASYHQEGGCEDGSASLPLDVGSSCCFLSYRHFESRRVREATQLAADAGSAAALEVGIDIVVADIGADHVDTVSAAAADIDADRVDMVLDVAAAAAVAAGELGHIGGLGDAANRLGQLATQKQDVESLPDMPTATAVVAVEPFGWQRSCDRRAADAAAMTVEVVAEPADIQGRIFHGWEDKMSDWFGQGVAIVVAVVAVGERSECVVGRPRTRWMDEARCNQHSFLT